MREALPGRVSASFPKDAARAAAPEAAVTEAALRESLGIPPDARRVLLFCESSHWDTNWLRTSEEYFEQRLRPIFAAMLEELEADPARVYCIESVFFFKLYWERHPEHRDRLRTLLERRQLRLLASSYTTPDTLLPHEESLFRDFHLGQRWLREQGFAMVPRTAYFPDNFGHSPHLPSLMSAVGVDSVAITRIDGMHFIASDYRPRAAFPFVGSTASLLQKQLRTLDFVWRADDGAEVLCHWNAFTYFQGDLLAHMGIVRWAGLDAAIPFRTRGHIARRIAGFVHQLEPLARTPYLLCPIGMDFNAPIPRLRPLLERYNRERYAETGTWTVLAGLDDYFALVGFHRGALPVLELDPNPYWMGFYASRPESKLLPARIARSLVLAEKLSAHAPHHDGIEAALDEAWHALVLHNHHDAITGTSPDRVWHGEQRPLLVRAELAADKALALASESSPDWIPVPGLDDAPADASTLRWWREGALLHIATAHYALTLSETLGGCATSLRVDDEEVLRGVGLDLVVYKDEGGLWRLGHEYRGGGFREVARASAAHCALAVHEAEGVVTVTAAGPLAGLPFRRKLTLRAESPLIELHVQGIASRGHTITCRLETALHGTQLAMDTIGGHIERPRLRHHDPTFWPVPSTAIVRSEECTLRVGFEAPTALSLRPTGELEWIVARNATKERAFFGLLPVLAHPIGGTEDGLQIHRALLLLTVAPGEDHVHHRALARGWHSPERLRLEDRAAAQLECDDARVTVTAVTRATDGQGVMARLACEGLLPRTVSLGLASGPLARAALCDAREHELSALTVREGRALVPLQERFATVRLVPA